MKYISLFSGIEAATVAWQPLGWEPIAYAEVEPFPKAVLKQHYPNVPDLGDMTKVDWKQYHHAADVVVGGSPCQAFSIAGLRKALDDPRGQLMLEYLRACAEIDPEWIVWENVPGVLSAEHGRAFQSLLEAVAELWPDGGAAWRVLDAQFFGVAQRRERVFLVVNTRDWRRAAPVLFERESLCWDSASSREKRETLTGGTANVIGNADSHVGECLTPGGNNVPLVKAFKWNQGERSRSLAIGDVSPTLSTDHNPAVYEIAGNIIGRGPMNGGHQLGVANPDENGAFTLTSTDRHAVAENRERSDVPGGQPGERRIELRPRADVDGARREGRADHIPVMTSNGDDVFPALCATDGSKRFIDNQSINGGRLLIDRRRT